MTYARPERLNDALALLAKGDWQVLAGGTDYYPSLRDARPSGKILDLTALEGTRGVNRTDGYFAIGALTTWTDVIKAELPPAFDGLKGAAREVGSVQIQNRATIAGNLCNASPAADGVPPLLSLDAQVELSSIIGTRRLALDAFILGNRHTALGAGELVTRILIPENSARGTSSFLKLGSRKYLVISISMVAVRLVVNGSGEIEEAAISVGACSEVAQRLPELEAALSRVRIDGGLPEIVTPAHLHMLKPIDDVRAPAEYRVDAALELVRRAIMLAADGVS